MYWNKHRTNGAVAFVIALAAFVVMYLYLPYGGETYYIALIVAIVFLVIAGVYAWKSNRLGKNDPLGIRDEDR